MWSGKLSTSIIEGMDGIRLSRVSGSYEGIDYYLNHVVIPCSNGSSFPDYQYSLCSLPGMMSEDLAIYGTS